MNKPATSLWSGLKTRLLRFLGSNPSPSTASDAAPNLKIGLALSSGGAKGLAHIGVLQVLEENGIPIDAMAGSSMGAYIAACWGYGYTGKEIEALAREVEGRWGWLRLVDPLLTPRRGFLKGTRIRDRLAAQIHNARFEDLRHPVHIIATKLDTFERVVFSSGDVAEAVHASIAVPGICRPVSINGESYVDGGIVDPVPVKALRDMNVDIIIAVRVLPTPETIREWIREGKACVGEFHGRCQKGRSGWFNRHFNYFAYGNILNTMMRAIHAAQIRIAEASCLQADLVLSPISPDGAWTDFTNPGKYIALGRACAEAQLDEIRRVLQQRTQPRSLRYVLPAPEPQVADHPERSVA